MADEGRDPAYLPDIRFTAADLAANRRGELTVDQQLLLEGVGDARTRVAKRNAVWGAAMIAALLGVGVVIELRRGESPIGPYLTVAGLALFFAVVIVVTYRDGRGLRTRAVSTAEGIGTAVVEERPWTSRAPNVTYTAYELHVRSDRYRWVFPFNDQASLDEVPVGVPLRVYFLATPPYPVILSYEAWVGGRPGG